MEQRIRIADSIRVLIPSITGIVLSLSYTSIRDGIFCIVLIIVIEILLRKRIVTMKIISSVLLMAAYVSLILYYIYLNSDVKLLSTVSQWMSICIGLVVIIKAFVQQKQGKKVELK